MVLLFGINLSQVTEIICYLPFSPVVEMRVLINSAIAGKLIGMQFEFFNAYSCCLISVLQYISSVIVNSFVSFDE